MSLQIGSRGPAVAAIQNKLNTMLSPSPRLVADGAFGPKTSQAVKLFQQRRGLSADGVVGAKTAAALGVPNPGQGGGGGGGFAAPPPPPGPPGAQPPTANGPPGFLDLSVFNVVGEAAVGGVQKIAASLLSWIDSDYVPQIVYDRAEGAINGAVGACASKIRAISKNVVTGGQDPAAYFTARYREQVALNVSMLCRAIQPLTSLPIIGAVASRNLMIISGVMSGIDSALANLRHNGQSAQAVATRIAGILDAAARQIR